MSVVLIGTVILQLLNIFDMVFSFFEGIKDVISDFLGIPIPDEAWISFWLFVALVISTYVLSLGKGPVESGFPIDEVGAESAAVFKAEEVAARSALEFLDDAFNKGEVSEQLFNRLKSFYSSKLDRISEQLARLSRFEEIRGIDLELEEAKREFLERLKPPSEVERPAVREEPVVEEVAVPKVEEAKVEPTVPSAPKGETLVQVLRDEMLRELRRLKEIIEKSS